MADNYFDLHFPRGGMDTSRAAMKQPWRPGPPGVGGEPTRIYTTSLARNVRSFDPITNRWRGGSRAGLKKYIANPVIAGWLIQHLKTVVGVSDSIGADMQGSQLGRVVEGIATCQGRVFWFSPTEDPDDRALTEATNSSSTTPPLNFNGLHRSSANNQKLYLVDGTHYRIYTPITHTVTDWTASAGSLPEDGDGNTARLIATYRGSTVLSGLLGDPQNWFMSRVSEPRDFDYGATPANDPTIAIAGNNSRLGFIGDVVTALMAYTDDEMIFGGNTSIYVMRGDPRTGGSIDLVTSAIGVAFGEAFTQDPKGNIYFMSNTGVIYVMSPRSMPEPISTPINQLVQDFDSGATAVRLEWNERYKGFHVFMTSLDGADVDDRHLFWEASNGWWPDRFGNKKHNPLASCVIDGNAPGDRVVLIGSWDGFIRSFDPDAEDDDGTPIESEVWIGPLLTKNFDEIKLQSIQAILAEASGDVNWAIHVGRTAEEALTSAATDASGTWSASRGVTELIRKSGHAIFLRLSSTNRWALEGIRAALSPILSKIRMRGH
jgi:hypothetical protein